MSEASATTDDLIGRVLDGRYRLESRLGEGGLGVVYRATQTRLDRRVAVKVLHPELAARGAVRTRFEREARSLGALTHPGIVSVIDFGIDGEMPYLVMELLEGRPLDVALRSGLSPERALAVARAVASALAHAHALGVVHRDLKPGNVFLQRGPEGVEIPRVLDFGLVKFLDDGSNDAVLTKTGAVMGTPAYMSPEQATGAAVDARSDVYSLGIMLFEMLAGRRPFTGPPVDLLRMHLLDEMPALESVRPGLPHVAELDRVLGRATAKSKKDRYLDASELLSALDALPYGAPSGAFGTPSGEYGVPAAGEVDGSLDQTMLSDVELGAPRMPGPSGPRAPASRTPLLMGVAVAVVVCALALGVGASLRMGTLGGAAEDGAPSLPVVAERLVEPPPVVTVQRIEPTRAGPDPLPAELEAIRARVPPGARLSKGDRRALFQWTRSNDADARALLLMAQLDLAWGARPDALRWYQRALEVDPASREHPDLRRGLVLLVGHARTSSQAARLVRDSIGPEALGDIDAVLGDPELDRDAARRIERLRSSLDGSESR